MILEKNAKLVMIGDSITDTGRTRPIAEGRGTLGSGYVNLVNAFLYAFYPELNIRVVNMGISGNTSRDLKERWQSDVLDLHPDYVSVMIGVNDVWRQYDSPQLPERHVYIEEYRENLEYLIKQTKDKVKEMIIITPFYIELNKDDLMRKTLLEYQAVCKELAEKYNLIFVDCQKEFDRVLQYQHSCLYAWDRVHPDTSGHLLIAKAFLNALGFTWK